MVTMNSQLDPHSQIEDLASTLQAYCAETGKDFAFYAAALDQSKTIDPALLKDPAFQAYWRLTNLQLNEIIDPTPINSEPCQVALPENFESLFLTTSTEMTEFNTTAVASDPSYATFLVTNDANQNTDSLLFDIQQAVSDSAESAMSTASGMVDSEQVTSDFDMIDEGDSSMGYSADARDFAERYGYEEEMSYAIGTEEGIRSTESSILTMLAEMDQQLVDLKEALQSGAISAEEFAADSDNISIYRETLLGMMNQLETSLMTVMETLSKLIEQAIEGRMAVINNSRAL